MKYIVNSIANLIINNAPSSDGEMMIRVDGFENIKIYESLARKVSKELSNEGLTVKIKLAKSKWNHFRDNSDESICVQAMKQNKWVAEEESITHYRNMHDTNVLILMGTENEEDKGGLLNFFTITPDALVSDLSGEYYRVFTDSLDLNQIEIDGINKLYRNLFEYVAVDICKLSNLADRGVNRIITINDFIEFFYETLPEWGLPYKKLELPTAVDLKRKDNILRMEYSFVSRQLFKKLSKSQYNKYKEQLKTYEDEKHEYSSCWEGWDKQGIRSYNEFADIVMGYVRGENIAEYKKKLIDTDFSIIEAILDIRIVKEKKERTTIPVVFGEPLEAFTSALLQMLCWAKETAVDVASFEFSIVQAEVVSMYSDSDDEEEQQQLKNTWAIICRHTNGVFEYMNRNMWSVNGEEVEIKYSPDNIFSPKCILTNINSGIVKAANSNKSINKIDFNVKCRDISGNIIRENGKNMVQPFMWKFSGTDAWLHNFSDICALDICTQEGENYIPIATINKLSSLLFAKSEEEFFDLYDESDIRFDFNLTKYVDEKTTDEAKLVSAKFDKLGKKFVKFVFSVANDGFYICIGKEQSELIQLIDEYTKLGNELVKNTLPENQKWILDAYVHAFNIEANTKVISDDTKATCCIVPAWHPTALEKLNDQKIFFLDGCTEWWDEQTSRDKVVKKDIEETVENLLQMSMIQSALDIFHSYGQLYFGAINSFGAFSVYGRSDIENNSRLKDMIHKDAIYDDDFDSKENAKMNDNARMIYGVLSDYTKAFPNSYRNLSIVFIDPTELQPIIASIYRYIEVIKKNYPDERLNINIKILVKPENKGGRNYLAYWMDECFSQDANVNIRTYLNEWRIKTDIDKLLNGNNDIVFVMDLLKVNNLQFVKESGTVKLDLSQCRFPIVFKPSPVSDTSSKVKRRIELSQPQFSSSYAHTQVVRYRNNSETLPDGNFIAVREVCIDSEAQGMVYALHEKSYWVVCVDSGMDGALLRNDDQHKNEYSIIGFSTGKGAYGQYNLTITARKTILETIKKKLECRLYQLFHWDKPNIDKAAELCLHEASGLDGISLLSAINQKDHNINEFMAYVLTSLRERETETQSALKIVIHLDSYKHWFSSELEKDEDESMSRPDFLVLEVNKSNNDKLQLNATVIECKISGIEFSGVHKVKAIAQVKHGIRRLSTIFNPDSKSIKRRYWFAQLYRALAFAQVTFSDNSTEFAELASKLRSVLDGNFDINWNGKVLGYWLDMDGEFDTIIETDESNIMIYDIPQKRIQHYLLDDAIETMKFVNINAEMLLDGENEDNQIVKRECEIEADLKSIQKNKLAVDVKLVRSIEYKNYNTEKNISDILKVADNAVEKNKYSFEAIEGMDTVERNLSESEAKDMNEIIDIIASKETQAPQKDNIIEKTENIDLENTRVLIGTDKASEKVYWEFGHKQLANRHMLITGTSGQGKTYSIQTMLYELSLSNVSSLIFDYTEGFRLDQLEAEFLDKMGDKVSQHIVKVEGVPIKPFKQHEIEIAGMKILEPAADVAARFANILIHVYGFGDQQFAAIFEATRIGIEKYGKDMDMSHFQEELESIKIKNKSAQTVLSKMAPFFWSITFKKDEEFDWGNILYSEAAMTKIFQLTLIDREMQVIITELMLWDAWYFTKKHGIKEKPFVVVLDEAQNLSHKANSPSAVILTEGRKFGWSAWFATQSLKVLADDEVVRLLQAAFKLYFKPTDDEVVKIAKQLDPTDGNIWIKALKSLKKGQCIVIGERIKQDGKFGLVKPTISSVTSFKGRK
ncbi:MAG: ATP-binding protein [Mobilitalea sp.]